VIVSVELEAKSCPSCGIMYAVPVEWFAALARRHDRGDAEVKWYCPNGHQTVFSCKAKQAAVERDRRLPSPQAAGGLARAASMTPERRRAIAKEAAHKRWHGGAHG
jgi:hypothetical protein